MKSLQQSGAVHAAGRSGMRYKAVDLILVLLGAAALMSWGLAPQMAKLTNFF